MPILKFVVVALVFLAGGCSGGDPRVSLEPPPNVPKQMVGGVCDYDEYIGECKFTAANGNGAVFRYKSTVDGRDVVLTENKIQEPVTGGVKVGDIFDCKLNLIVNGTCTPCLFTSQLFTIGECGKDAWELFRKR